MKKLLIACSMVGACALVACADTLSVQGTPKTTPLDWFDVTTTATNHGTLAIAEGSDALCEVVGDKFEIDSDIDNLVTFTTANDSPLTQQLAKVTFNLDAAVVPYGALQQFTDENNKPKIAFALYQSESNGTATNFTAWVGGSEWITLTGETPDEGEPYTLIMEFDNQAIDVNKVRFSTVVGNTTNVLSGTGATGGWFSSTNRVSDTVNVNFVGCGKVASFGGKQLQVIGEIIVIGGGTIEVKKEDVAAFEKAKPEKYSSVDLFLAATASEAFEDTSFQSGLTVAEAYAIGLVAKDDSDKMAPVDGGALKVKADAQASTTDGIKVALNITPPDVKDTGATIRYQLQGSATGVADSYVNIGDPATNQDAIKIPTANVGVGEGKYRYFKVKTIVTLKPAQ